MVTQTLDQPFEPRGGSVYGLSIVVRFDPVTQRKCLTITHAQNTASQLERTINRWAVEVLHMTSAPTAALQEAVLTDLTDVGESTALFSDVRPMVVQSLLRHAISEVISEGIINSLVVSNSSEANSELTRIHERLLARTSPSYPIECRKRSSDALFLFRGCDRRCCLASPHILRRTRASKPRDDADDLRAKAAVTRGARAGQRRGPARDARRARGRVQILVYAAWHGHGPRRGRTLPLVRPQARERVASRPGRARETLPSWRAWRGRPCWRDCFSWTL